MVRTLLKEGGKAYFATKSYYFGVGGGVQEFAALLEQKGKDEELGLTWESFSVTEKTKEKGGECGRGLEREIFVVTKNHE
jgi:hypothetical protein